MIGPITPNDWIYIYYILEDKIICDRTVSRTGLGPQRAEQVVKKWREVGHEAFYTIGTAIKGAYS